MSLLLLSCGGDSDAPSDGGTPASRREIVFFSSFSGPGDNGYNDMIVESEMSFAARHQDLTTHFYTSDSQQIIEGLLQANFLHGGNKDSLLLVLNSSDHTAFLNQLRENHPDSQPNILFIEPSSSQLPDGVTSFTINRYGVSYIAGRLASAAHVLVVAAMQGDALVDAAVRGFLDGYSVEGAFTPRVHYLSDGPAGFADPGGAMRACDSVAREVLPPAVFQGATLLDDNPGLCIFPVAGGSNVGVYSYANAQPYERLISAVGMDKDYCGTSKAIPFSCVLPVGELTTLFLNSWYTDYQFPQQRSYGLEGNPGTRIVLSPQSQLSFLRWISPTECGAPASSPVIKDSLEKYLQEAVQKEKAYASRQKNVN